MTESTGFVFPELYKDNPFRDNMGHRLFQMLFWELSKNKAMALYTLKDFDHEGCKSLYRLYMAEMDPTEYRFATKYFDSYDHWIAISKKQWMSPFIARWREELDIKLRSEALNRIVTESKSGSKSSFMANKFLLEKGWAAKDKKGRPSKDQVLSAAKELAKDNEVTNEDYLRVVENN
jgi:hypothetical protein